MVAIEKTALSYEKLLSILNSLPEEDGNYVLLFVLNNSQKLQLKRAALCREREEVEVEREHLRQKKAETTRREQALNVLFRKWKEGGDFI